MSIDTSVGRVDGVRVSIDTSVQVSGQGSVSVPIGAAWAAWPAAALAYAGPSPALLGLAGYTLGASALARPPTLNDNHNTSNPPWSAPARRAPREKGL